MSRRMLLDGAVTALALAGTLAQLHHGSLTGGTPGRLDATGVVLAACATVPLIAWRRFPLAVFIVTAGTSAVLAGLGYPVDLIPGPTVALYLLASTGRRVATVVVIMLAAYLTAAAAAAAALPGTELLHTSLAWSVAWFAGDRTRLRREQLAEFRQRAVRAERDAERERQLAVAEERARIARDLHDSAGHAINVIAVRAGAARLRRDPDRSEAALRVIEDIARVTAGEIDRTVGSLRDRIPVGLASLESLIEQHAGLAVTTETVGTPPPLSAAVDQAAYRILQEALTNAARHGTAATATVRLVYGSLSLDLTVTNPARTDGTTRGGGHGLIGMRERATLVGGSVEASRAGDTFQVHARLPYGIRS